VNPVTVAAAINPMLEPLLDADVMTERLRSLLCRTDVTVVGAALLDHKPEHRAIVGYSISDPSGTATIYGKAYVDRSHAERVHLLMQRLWQECSESPRLTVPQPLGLDTRLGLVWYVPVTGRSLDRMVSTPSLHVALEGTAQWLARLHRSGLRLDRSLDLEHEVMAVMSWAELVAIRHPQLAARATRLAAALEAGRTALQLDVTTPIHKDFHYQHVFVGDRIGVVDLDEARMGDASFDLAHFAANLDLLALRAGTSRTERARWHEAFLGTYASITGWQRDARFEWCAGYTYVKIAKQLATGRGPRPRPDSRARATQIEWVLAEGLKCLER
jgi:hypothetical protein